MSEYDYDKEQGEESRPSDQRDSASDGYRPPPWSQQEPPKRSAPPTGGYQQRPGAYNKEPYPRTYDQNRTSGGNTYRRANQTPYQYSANNGWQQPKPQQRYEWDFEEYDQALPGKQRKRKNRGLVIFAVSLLCVLAVGLLSLTGYNIIRALGDGNTPSVSEPLLAETSQSPSQPEIDRSDEVSMSVAAKPPASDEMPEVGEKMTIPQVAKSVRPAVVGVVNYQSSTYFEPATEGSGIILSEDGYIITNAHVVEGADAIVVIFGDDAENEAVLIGADARTDLAVLKVNRDDLDPAIFGDSNELEVGETVIAIGNPGGIQLAGSVTQGIVSAVNREVKTPYYSTNYIQTDAAINPGNSGGALCNEYGQVVGINSAKLMDGYEGIGFAIPITDAIPIIDDLIRNGRVTGRVLLGITGNPISELYARDRNIPAGVQIATITSEELTQRGVIRGDIITHIDDERVLDVNDIYTILQQHQPGDTVKLTLFRQTSVTQSRTFDVVVPLMEDTGP